MEWSKYVLSLTVGGCLLILFGKKGDGRDKWLLGGGAGVSLMSMELAVEYMLRKAAWEMALSIMKGGAFFSVIVLAGYMLEWAAGQERKAGRPGRGASNPTVDGGVSGKLCTTIPKFLYGTPAGGRT